MAFTNWPITANGQSTPAAGGGPRGRVVRVQVAGTWTGTLQFESSVDGVTWVATHGLPVGVAEANTTAVTTTTANGSWNVNSHGAAGVRVTATAVMTGQANVSLANGSV
jgi:hypothetical protein